MEALMRRFLTILTALTLLCFGLPVSTVQAEDPGYTDTTYWNNLCTGGQTLSADQKTACSAYMNYMSSQSSSLREQLAAIDAQKAEITKNIAAAAEKIKDYQSQADSLNSQIADLNGQIAVKEKEIEAKQADIDAKQADVDALTQKLKDRMTEAQGTMRLNTYLDILMGASSFTEMIRIANGIADISNYDNKTLDSLGTLIDELNSEKTDLEAAKTELDTQKQEVVDKQNSLLALKYQQQLVQDEYEKQSAELEAQGNTVAAALDSIKAAIQAISAALNEIATSPGWIYPVPGASRSAGTWYYSGGGVHLGEDFAAAQGTAILAAGNGVVINSVDGCPYGYLGSNCGNAYGGSYGGGNQVYLLTSINGSLYAIKYLHMLAGTPIAKATIVSQGDVIGRVGSSGNSTGPHCHIEVFYLGSGTSLSGYASSWNGDLAFGCGWGSAALNRLCENGVGVPCRIKPESVFG